MAAEDDIAEFLDFYENLLIIQYHDKPKAKATIRLLSEEIFASGILLDVQDAFNLDTAVGVQLDVMGKYAGVDRFFFSGIITDDVFGFADAVSPGSVSSNIIGFDDADAPDKDGLFWDAENIVGSDLKLNDDAFRALIKLKIAQNNSTHDIVNITELLIQSFGSDVIVVDNYDMTMTYLFSNISDQLIQAAIDKKVLPRPIGVGTQSILGTEFFGFADATRLGSIAGFVNGFNDAVSGFTKIGGFLDANNDIL